MCERHQILCSLSLAILLVLSVRGRVIPGDGQQSASTDLDTCHEVNKSRSEIRCSETEEASGYSLTIDADEFKANEIINVKVYRTRCPNLESTSCTKWYTLEVFSDSQNSTNGTLEGEYPGKLQPIFHRADIYSCENETKMLFYPCESNLYDFPGRFIWMAPSVDSLLIGSICFRLTVLEENSDTCETVTKCISGAEAESESIISDLISETDDYEEYTEDDELLESHSLANLTDIVISEETSHTQMPPTCKQDQEFYRQFHSSWLPHCDCDGYYHPVQCFTQPHSQVTSCWCSTKYGSEVLGTRVNVECDGVSVTAFELSCIPGYLTDRGV